MHLQDIQDLLLHCTRALQVKVLDFWKLMHCMTYLFHRNRFYHSWTAVVQSVWRETTDEKCKN